MRYTVDGTDPRDNFTLDNHHNNPPFRIHDEDAQDWTMSVFDTREAAQQAASALNMERDAVNNSRRESMEDYAEFFDDGLPTEPGRYLVVEKSTGDAIAAWNEETLQDCVTTINESETQRDDVLIVDLDTDEEIAVVLKVSALLATNPHAVLWESAPA